MSIRFRDSSLPSGFRGAVVEVDDYVEWGFKSRFGLGMYSRLKRGMQSYLRDGSSRLLFTSLRMLLGPDLSSERSVVGMFRLAFNMPQERLFFEVTGLDVVVSDSDGDVRFKGSALEDLWIFWLPSVFNLE